MGFDRLMEIGSTIRGWFHDPFDEMGYSAVPRRWGTYWSNAQVYVSGLQEGEVDAFLQDLQDYYSDRTESILIHLDHAADKAAIGPALIEARCSAPTHEVYLVHGAATEHSGIDVPVQLQPVTAGNLQQFADTKIRSWTGNESDPDPEDLEAEINRRKRELEGTGRGLLAMIDEKAAGFIWWHDDTSRIRWIRQVATRVPFRQQGIARRMLSECLETAYGSGMVAVVISVDPSNSKARDLYRSLGFFDQVYEIQTYEYLPRTPPGQIDPNW